MKPVKQQTNDQLMKWAYKTARTINNMSYANKRGYDFYIRIDRYETLKEEMQQRGIWETYCDAKSWGYHHDAYDCAA